MIHLLLKPLATALNKAIQTDPTSQQRLSALDGTRFKVCLTDINLVMIFSANQDTVTITPEDDCVCHVTVKGTSLAFIQSLLAGNNAASAKKFALHIEGSTHTAQAWQQLFAQCNVDWQALLAPIVGEQPAHQGLKFARFIHQQTKKVAQKLCQDSAEYLKHEKQILVPEHRIQYFSHEVTDLRQATERLEARIYRLEQTNNA